MSRSPDLSSIFVLSFTSSDAHAPDQAIKSVAHAAASAPGTIATYAGLQVEPGPHGAKILWLVVESTAWHQNTPGSIPEPVADVLRKIADPANAKVYHIPFPSIALPATTGPRPSFDSPVCEVATVRLRRPENRQGLAKIWDMFYGSEGAQGAVGITREDDQLYFAVRGYASVEAHLQLIADTPIYATLVGEVNDLAETSVVHVAFQMY
ncbi:hypothetical protein PUNSTDRAFT_132141 [Punctularia strigosozonata HHB-11173 SS5]|uniref:uncharacterized protein n=1 Tax=Punctularia strigosozonata (strain HHB-11173) TaxID=741275 RepID=UPI00044173A1|nr:uncharacterized protein PUNSTDRAFT_132141 [Punctularia strigosozonata HHB-11173 SS5]EIN12003.1 hypothetical protein PUNSTDRAFT_132141 [Punctularia strigosozonata HHB-11173 SS5]